MLQGRQDSSDTVITSGSLWEVKILGCSFGYIYSIKLVVKHNILNNIKPEPEKREPQESIKIEVFKCAK